MRIDVWFFIEIWVLSAAMSLAAMDRCSSMNQDFFADLYSNVHPVVKDNSKQPVRWADLLSDSDSEPESADVHKDGGVLSVRSAKGLEFEIAGLAELEKKQGLEEKVRSLGVDGDSEASSSFEQDYAQQGMREISKHAETRVLARRDALTVQVTEGELQIFDGQNPVYDGTGCHATHAAISPSRDRVTAACRDADDQLLFLTISLPNTAVENRPIKETFDELPLIPLGKSEVAISAISELSYLSDNKVRVMATAYTPPVDEDEDTSDHTDVLQKLLPEPPLE